MKAVFLGLGRMGGNMARRIAQAGLPLDVYNRDGQKSAPFAALGVTVHAGLDEAVANADIVFTMLTDDAALKEVMTEERLAALSPGGVHVSMSTISVGLAAGMADEHERLGRGYVACPVFGRPDAAAGGTLRLCLAGRAQWKQKITPYLEPMGEIRDLGDVPAGANAVKLAGNFMISALMEMLSEAFTLVENSGVAPEKFYELMSTTLFNAPAVKTYGRLVLDGVFEPAGFAARLGAKDIGLVREAARRVHTPMPLASLLEDRFLRALARGLGEKDWSVIGRLQREDAGLDTAAHSGRKT
jgi:3-hydroxyisobutyrate dehydrogenase-like beta-hydroxyacid dehydrogenase